MLIFGPYLFTAVTGGPLADRYQLAVIRFHWGNDNDTGSEHSVDGQKHPLEVSHLDFINICCVIHASLALNTFSFSQFKVEFSNRSNLFTGTKVSTKISERLLSEKTDFVL